MHLKKVDQAQDALIQTLDSKVWIKQNWTNAVM